MNPSTESTSRPSALGSALKDLVFLARRCSGADLAWVEWIGADGASLVVESGFDAPHAAPRPELEAPLLARIVPPLTLADGAGDPRLAGTALAACGARSLLVLPLEDRGGVVRGAFGIGSRKARGVGADQGELAALARQALVALECHAASPAPHADESDGRRKELERSNEKLERFVCSVSHDLRGPLRSILHLAEWIREDGWAVLPEKARQHLAKLQASTERLRELLDSLLEYSRAGGLDEGVQTVELAGLVDEVRDILHPSPGFEVVRAGPMPVIEAALTPLRQVLMNLVGNALMHHDRSSGRVEVSAREAGGVLEVLVSDDGPGIPPKHRERVFEMFQTLAPRGRHASTGMGLALVQRLAEIHGGSVVVEAWEERGARVRFRWPCRRV